MMKLSKKDEIALRNLHKRIEQLHKSAQPVAGLGPHAGDIVLAQHVAGVLKAMFAHCPSTIASALHPLGLKREITDALADAAKLPDMDREQAVNVLRQLASGNIVEDHVEVELARGTLGSEAAQIEKQLERSHREDASSRDFMRRKHRVPGSAYSAQR